MHASLLDACLAACPPPALMLPRCVVAPACAPACLPEVLFSSRRAFIAAPRLPPHARSSGRPLSPSLAYAPDLTHPPARHAGIHKPTDDLRGHPGRPAGGCCAAPEVACSVCQRSICVGILAALELETRRCVSGPHPPPPAFLIKKAAAAFLDQRRAASLACQGCLLRRASPVLRWRYLSNPLQPRLLPPCAGQCGAACDPVAHDVWPCCPAGSTAGPG